MLRWLVILKGKPLLFEYLRKAIDVPEVVEAFWHVEGYSLGS